MYTIQPFWSGLSRPSFNMYTRDSVSPRRRVSGPCVHNLHAARPKSGPCLEPSQQRPERRAGRLRPGLARGGRDLALQPVGARQRARRRRQQRARQQPAAAGALGALSSLRRWPYTLRVVRLKKLSLHAHGTAVSQAGHTNSGVTDPPCPPDRQAALACEVLMPPKSSSVASSSSSMSAARVSASSTSLCAWVAPTCAPITRY